MPAPQVQLTVFLHWMTKGAYRLSLNGDDRMSQWVQRSEVTIHHSKNKVLVITMPERLAVKKKLIAVGALAFGGFENDSFVDKGTDG